MKNKQVILIVCLIFLSSVLGCRFYNPLSKSSDESNSAKPENKDVSEKMIDKTVGEERIGVPECDELLDFFADQTRTKDDNYVVKATREFYFNKIRENIKKDLEDNKNDPNKKEEMAKNCREYKKQLDKFKAEEDNEKK